MSKIKIGNIKGPKGDKGETGAVGPKGEQGIQGPVGPAGGVNSVNGMTGDVTVEDTFTALDGIPEMHRNLYRGRNLGESTQMSAEHKAAIQNGSFKDLWVGDYWTHDNIIYRIADIDYFWNCGDTSFTTHHLVIVPDTGLYKAQMNSSNITDGGYVGSDMYIKNLEEAKKKFAEAFPGMVLTHREFLVDAVSNGHASNGNWYNSTVELMNEVMMYGTKIFSPMGNGTITPANYTTSNSQLSLFRLNPKMIKINQNYWLSDVVNTAFASVYGGNLANRRSASDNLGVRPYACIGAQPTGDESDDDMELSPMHEGDYMEEELE